MLVYTCPKCGGELQFSDIATYPPIHIAECPSCGWREEERDTIEKIPYKTTTLSVVKDVYTKADVITVLTELQKEIEKLEPPKSYQNEYTNAYLGAMAMKEKYKCIIQSKINELKGTNS